MYLKYSEIPGNHKLFLDYLYDFENVEKFYHKNFRDKDLYLEQFEKITSKTKNHPNEMVEILKKQYDQFSPSKQTLSNIDALRSEKTLAIVTGQQLGVFGGPLYTFYKIISVIKLSKHLKENHHSYNFVPIFWLEGDDHDFDEIKTFTLLDNENSPVKLEYDDGLDPEINRGSVGKLDIAINIESLFEQLDKLLRNTEYKEELISRMSSIYAEKKSFKKAFADLLFEIFDDYGLIIFDPTDSKVKDLLKPVFKKEIENFHTHTASVVETSAELDETYHTQVKVKPINLFVSDEDERLLLEPVDGEFRLKGKRKKFTKNEILQMLEDEPSRFSPNVLMRPICQDYLFPTAVYVAGPGEISYFAQVIPLYQHFNLEFSDFYSDEKELVTKVINSISELNLGTEFSTALENIKTVTDDLQSKLAKLDPALDSLTEKSYQRIEQTLVVLKDKAENFEKRRFETSLRQLKKSRNSLYPNEILQERELNFIYFANKYGWDILKWIFEEVSINKFEHQYIILETH